MSDETSTTIREYDTHAERYAGYLGRAPLEREPDRFAALLLAKARVVDIGAGPGRYTLALQARDPNAVALDLSAALLRAGQALGVTRCVLADMVRLPFASGAIDGAWACASLLHLPVAVMPLVLAELRRIVRADGAAYFSVKQGHGTEWVASPGGGQRSFAYYQPDQFFSLLAAAGWHLVDGFVADDATRPALSWIVRFCRAE